MSETGHLPSRRERLATFIRVKKQRRLLVIAVALLLPAIALLGFAYVDKSDEADAISLGSGQASYYGLKFAGRQTANGERFDYRSLTAAHRSLPFGSKVRVTNARNGKSVIVRINDRGPFNRSRVIDLSKAAAQKIGLIKRGHGKVHLVLLRN